MDSGWKYFLFQANEQLWGVREKAGFFEQGGHGPVKLDTGVLAADHPLPNADGKRLYFRGSTHGRNEFLRYNIKTGQFALELPGVSGTELTYSRDGKWVAYVSFPDGFLFRSAADGSERLQLTPPSLGVGTPQWCPDGRQIAFTGSPRAPMDDANVGHPRIYIVPFDGGVPRQVSNGESWSPDEASLAFGSLLAHPAYVSIIKTTDAVIHVLDLKTMHVSSLPGSQDMWGPRWSPDGRFIAGSSGSTAKLMLYDMRTQTQTEIFNHDFACANWSPNGEFLFLSSAGAWWQVRLRDRKVELVSDLKNISIAGWGWFAMAPNNALITARNIGTTEIYALDLEAP